VKNVRAPAQNARAIAAASSVIAGLPVKIVLEPIFEADMVDCSFGFQPRRSAHDALQVLIDECWQGRRWVVVTSRRVSRRFRTIG